MPIFMALTGVGIWNAVLEILYLKYQTVELVHLDEHLINDFQS